MTFCCLHGKSGSSCLLTSNCQYTASYFSRSDSGLFHFARECSYIKIQCQLFLDYASYSQLDVRQFHVVAVVGVIDEVEQHLRINQYATHINDVL